MTLYSLLESTSSCKTILIILFLLFLPTLAVATNNNNNEEVNRLLHRSPNDLQNDYWILRHGQSQANVAKVIASSPEIACHKYGLSDVGKEQAAQAGEDVIQAFQNDPKCHSVLLLSSDLLRAKETAQIVRGKLEQAGIPLLEMSSNPEEQGLIMEPRLRERWFGEWDETSDQNYPNVWKDDATNPDHTIRGVESVNSVVARTSECICEWEDQRLKYNVDGRCMVICVAHGDVLQILQTAFAKMDPAKHRTLEHLETAKLRKLELKE